MLRCLDQSLFLKMTFKLRTNFNFVSGYATILDVILKELYKYDSIANCIPLGPVDLKYKQYFNDKTNYNTNDIELLMLPPPNNFDMVHPIFRICPIKNRVIFTMWESTMVDFSFIEELNKTKCVIVPNEWNKTNFIRQGVNVPIEVLNLFVKPMEILPEDKGGKFVFGTANGDARKQLDKVIRCFFKAFPKNENDVILKVKTSTYNKRIQHIDSRIVSDHVNFSETELSKWYNSIDVFVSGATAEGWGMMQCESMSCGVPVIATKYAALTEYFNSDNGYPVKYDEVPSTDYWMVPGGRWSQFDEYDMINQMRHCYNNRAEVSDKGLRSISTMKKYSIDAFMIGLLNILKKYS